ncbi:MAG: hypothetical protein HYY06_29930 [Deltaproteobacteria bacterium]|nr:hypothetical protein [Deltaproteobacteria bacterium]
MASSVARRALLGIAIGTPALGALGGVIAGLVLWLSAGIREVTHQFLGALRAGRPDVAYALTSAELRARVPPQQLLAYVDRDAPNVRGSQSEWINGFAGGSGDEWCLDVWLSRADGWPTSVYLILVSENDQWRVSEVTAAEPAMCDID